MTIYRGRRQVQLWNPELADPIAVDVFNHWREIADHPRAKLDKERHDLIVGHLLIGYSADDLKLAIDGNVASAWHQGENASGVVYDQLSIIFGSAEDVDRFMRVGEQAHRVLKQREERRAAMTGDTSAAPTEEKKAEVRALLRSVRLKRVA